MKTSLLLSAATLVLGVAAGAACAQDAPASAPAPTPMASPAMSWTLSANPNPMSFDAGPFGKVHITGALSGGAFAQDNHLPGDHSSLADVTNAQVIAQTTEGPLQFFVEAGAYALPSLGTPYVRARTFDDNTYGFVPYAYVKLAPSSSFNIIAGKLPTLSGAETTFSFQNINVDRGLLWNQENTVNRGVQANVSRGPLSASIAWTDGFYSNRYNWLSGSVSWAINPSNTITAVAMGNLGHTSKASFVTPLAQNNSEIYNLIYTHTSGAWSVSPYVQYTHVAADPSIGIAHSASTTGAALLTSYRFSPSWSVAGRGEYISSTGTLANGAPSLLYGPGSKAWSLTLTPTWQKGIYFIRGEASYTRLMDFTPGFGFGANLDKSSQARFAIETGVIY